MAVAATERAAWRCTDDYDEKMSLLCESFPTLAGRPGTRPWDQETFAKWLAGPAPSSAIRQAGLFVLNVWNGSNGFGEPPWWSETFGLGLFDPVHAIAVWDHLHQQAFIDWCCEPFYP